MTLKTRLRHYHGHDAMRIRLKIEFRLTAAGGGMKVHFRFSPIRPDRRIVNLPHPRKRVWNSRSQVCLRTVGYPAVEITLRLIGYRIRTNYWIYPPHPPRTDFSRSWGNATITIRLAYSVRNCRLNWRLGTSRKNQQLLKEIWREIEYFITGLFPFKGPWKTKSRAKFDGNHSGRT